MCIGQHVWDNNRRSNLVAALVPRLNHKLAEVRITCADAITKLFKEEAEFEAALEVVKGISKLVKSSNYQVRYHWLGYHW